MKVVGARSVLTVSGTRDERIATIARLQRGRISRRQLAAAGVSSTTVARLVAQGQLHPLLRGVFAVGHLAPIELAAETAALLAVRDGAALSHHTAARLWSLRPQGSGDGLIHVLVGPTSGGKLAGVRIHRTRILARQDLRVFNGLPVTSPARTLLDLAELLTERQLELAYDQALILKFVRAQDVAEVLERASGRAGVRALKALVARERSPFTTRSEAEERFLAVIRGAGLAEPEVNVRLHGYEVDFLWRDQRVVVEIDGFRYHSTRSSFERDHRKDLALQVHGLTILRFTWRQLDREPLAVVARVAAALGPGPS